MENRILHDKNQGDTGNEALGEIMNKLDKIDLMLERITRVKDCLDGDSLLDNQDMCTLLRVTKRTLARYRQKGLVNYYMIDGRAYYKASEVQGFLKRKGKSSMIQ